MADETTATTEQQFDLTKRPAGAWSTTDLQGIPVDTFIDRLFGRSGIPQAHSLRKDLNPIHPNETLKVPRLPAEFDPGNYNGPLSSVQDWLDYIKLLDTTPATREIAETPLTVRPLTADLAQINEALSVGAPLIQERTESQALEGATATSPVFDALQAEEAAVIEPTPAAPSGKSKNAV